MSPDLKAKVREALTKNEGLKQAPPAECDTQAGPVRTAATALNEALEGESVLTALAPVKYYKKLQDANRDVIEALKPPGATYDEADKRVVVGALDEFRGVVRRLQQLEDAVSSAAVEPLLSKRTRVTVGVLSVVLFTLGAISAVIGTGEPNARYTTLAYWFAVASFALAVLWLFAFFLARPSVAPPVETEQAGLRLQYIVFGGLAFLVLGVLAAGILTNRLVEPLQSVPGARGLITFLIAIGTIAIAVILTLASVVMEAKDTEALKERLSKGKEILTVLVGVLGTIVGFYFASNPEGSVAGKMTVAVVDKPPRVEVGADASVLAMTTGGELPYDPTPIFTFGKEGKSEASMIEGSVSAQGVIKVKFKVSESVKPGTIPFVVGSRDKAGKTGSFKDHIEVVDKKAP
jgi:hypothetical protein